MRLTVTPILALVLVVAALGGAGRTPGATADRANPVAVATYVVTDLGTLGGEESSAVGIAGTGWVVGNAEDAEGRTRAFLWQEGRMIGLGTLGGPDSNAIAVSDRGQVVGSADFGSAPAGRRPRSAAFLWEDRRMTALPGLGGGRRYRVHR